MLKRCLVAKDYINEYLTFLLLHIPFKNYNFMCLNSNNKIYRTIFNTLIL